MEPDLHEIYRLERENNQMLKSLKRRSLWGGIFKLLIYLLALGIPIWLYFTYLYPIVQQVNRTLTEVSGKKVELEGQFGEWADMFAQFRSRFTGATTSTTTKQ